MSGEVADEGRKYLVLHASDCVSSVEPTQQPEDIECDKKTTSWKVKNDNCIH